jgi:alpha-L-rhamnosidase
LFDETKALYLDCSGSQATNSGINALAVKAEMFDDEQLAQVVQYIIQKEPETRTILTYDVLDVLCANGKTEKAIEFIVGNDTIGWGRMIKLGYKTIWEGFDNIESHSHAWNCYPGRIFQQYILGIQASEPGFTKAVIKPSLGDLEYAKGTVYTKNGVIRVLYQKAGTQFIFDITMPAKIHADLEYGNKITELKTGKNHFVYNI